jgi:hypothetical protein
LIRHLQPRRYTRRNVTSLQRGGRGQGNGSVDGRGTSECAALIGPTGDDLGFAQPWSSGKSRTANQQQLDTHDHHKRKLPSQQQTAGFLSATRFDALASACFGGLEVFSIESPALGPDKDSTALAHGVANFVTPLRLLSRCVGELSIAGKAWDARVGWAADDACIHPRHVEGLPLPRHGPASCIRRPGSRPLAFPFYLFSSLFLCSASCPRLALVGHLLPALRT